MKTILVSGIKWVTHWWQFSTIWVPWIKIWFSITKQSHTGSVIRLPAFNRIVSFRYRIKSAAFSRIHHQVGSFPANPPTTSLQFWAWLQTLIDTASLPTCWGGTVPAPGSFPALPSMASKSCLNWPLLGMTHILSWHRYHCAPSSQKLGLPCNFRSFRRIRLQLFAPIQCPRQRGLQGLTAGSHTPLLQVQCIISFLLYNFFCTLVNFKSFYHLT